ncbi:MAG TPA: YggS family pyridoxal phosphate-dependent enzyme [Candidatus Binatia bacterium]|nr:YggS family pyridoxal phosphate-dependent enzyme [Candidatus Binatia bacterium]
MTHISEPIADRLAAVRARLAAACRAAGRDAAGVRLVAVGKTFGADALVRAADAGQRDFGENYLQEALPKIAALRAARADLVWHFIGPIQGNKTADIAAHFDWVHGVERERIARRLSAQRPAGAPPLQVCVQVNISGEQSKSGIAPAGAPALCHAVAALPGLKLRGLMAIPAPARAGADPRAAYRVLRELFEALRRDGFDLDTLSAGMSDDLEAAIAEGATLVRIGTAIFGTRT